MSDHSAGYEEVVRVWLFNPTDKLDPDVSELLSMHCSWCVLDCGEAHCAGNLPEGVPRERCREQESQQCHSCQSRIDAECQTKACNNFKASSTQHEKGHHAGGGATVDEFFCSSGLADDPEAMQKKYDRYENTRKG